MAVNGAREVILKDVEFLKAFSWETFHSLRDTSFVLLGLLAIVAIILELLFSGAGRSEYSSGDYSTIFIKVLFVSLVLISFESIIEGAKDFIWAVEIQIHQNTPIENVLLHFEDLSEESMQSGFFSKLAGGATGLMVQYVGALGMWLMSLLVNFKLLFFQFVWFFVIVVAPLVLPLGVIQYFSNLVSIYVYLIVFLLLIRIPWAILSLCMKNLISIAENGNVGGFTTGVLFFICIMMSWTLPTVLGFIFFRSSMAMRGVSMGLSSMRSGLLSSGASQASGVQSGGGRGIGAKIESFTKYGVAGAAVGTVATNYLQQSAKNDLPINFELGLRGG